MYPKNYSRYLITLLVALALVLAACGGRNQEEAPAEEAPLAEAAPLADAEEAEPTEEAAEEAAEEAEEEAAEEEPAADTAAEDAAMGVLTMVDEYMASIPEGYMAVGKLDAFKDIMATGEAVLIDVRETSEYEEGHIEGAVNIPLRTIAQNLDKIPTDQPVMVYCASGHRAGMSVSALRMLGYDNVRSFPPSWKGWTAAEEPVSMEAVEGETYDVPEIDADLLAAVDGFLSGIPEGFYTAGNAEKLAEAMDAGAFLVDVRQPSEFEEGAIPTAINVPLRDVAASRERIPTDQPVIVYCASGHRAALATAALHTMGYANVRSFTGGYAGWLAAQGADGDVPTEAAAEPLDDMVAVVDEYLSSIPEGYMAVGKLDAFKEMMESADPLLIDVREESEYADGHIEGAINIPIRTLAQNLDKIPTDVPVMVYCASGHRAGMATSALRTLGYDNVRAYPPGWKGWTGADEPVSTEPVEAEMVEPLEVDDAVLATVDEFLSAIPEGYYAIGDVEKLNGALDAGAFLIDVREESEYADGHIPGAVDIPIRTLAQSLDQIPTDQPVIVYCASGFRAALSTSALHMMGYDNVRSFPPSYAGWESAGEVTE